MSTQNLIDKNLINGPSKLDLLGSLAYAHNKKQQLQVEFTCEDGEILKGTIEGMAHEDGSGESFNLEFRLRDRIGGPEPTVPVCAAVAPTGTTVYSMYYDSARRRGLISIEPKAYLPGDRAAWGKSARLG